MRLKSKGHDVLQALDGMTSTARTSAEDKIRARNVSAFGYLHKPFEPQELLTLVEQALCA